MQEKNVGHIKRGRGTGAGETETFKFRCPRWLWEAAGKVCNRSEIMRAALLAQIESDAEQSIGGDGDKRVSK